MEVDRIDTSATLTSIQRIAMMRRLSPRGAGSPRTAVSRQRSKATDRSPRPPLPPGSDPGTCEQLRERPDSRFPSNAAGPRPGSRAEALAGPRPRRRVHDRGRRHRSAIAPPTRPQQWLAPDPARERSPHAVQRRRPACHSGDCAATPSHSMPTIAGGEKLRGPRRRTMRNSVSLLASTLSRREREAAGPPPSAKARQWTPSSRRLVRLALGSTASKRSAKIRRSQAQRRRKSDGFAKSALSRPGGRKIRQSSLPTVHAATNTSAHRASANGRRALIAITKSPSSLVALSNDKPASDKR